MDARADHGVFPEKHAQPRARHLHRDQPLHRLAGAGHGLQDRHAKDPRAARTGKKGARPEVQPARIPRSGAARWRRAHGHPRGERPRLDREEKGLSASGLSILLVDISPRLNSGGYGRPVMRRRLSHTMAAAMAALSDSAPPPRLAHLAPNLGIVTRCVRSEEHTSELQSPDHLVCRLLLEKKK